tara:strand:+ start:1414 stop:2415 length:1002 start_codon:yes stop_codon:yes gene_type:complete
MSRIRADKFVNNAATGAPQLTFGAEVVAGVGITGAGGINVGGAVTAASGNFTGAVTVGGVLTYEDVTNIDSLGIITARSDVSIADSIFHTGDTNTAIRFPAADTFSVETAGSERLRIDSTGRIGVGTDSFNDAAEVMRVQAVTGQSNTLFTIKANSTTGSSILNFGDNDFNEGRIIYGHSDNSMQFRTDDAERLRITSTGGVHFNNAELIERVSIVANKLSAVPNVSLDNGMVHYYTTNETTTATPNIISTAGINTSMATGDTMSVTILSKPNNAGYFPKVSIDGVATGITTYWSGGSAPSSAESSGVDVNVYQIIKTADATYDVLANTSNFA